jgi:hypothetical protein
VQSCFFVQIYMIQVTVAAILVGSQVLGSLYCYDIESQQPFRMPAQGMRDGQAALQPRQAKMLVAYPNSGEEWDAGARDWRGDTGHDVEQFASSTVTWADCGATMIGGCCRTTPAHIAALAGRLAL